MKKHSAARYLESSIFALVALLFFDSIQEPFSIFQIREWFKSPSACITALVICIAGSFISLKQFNKDEQDRGFFLAVIAVLLLAYYPFWLWVFHAPKNEIGAIFVFAVGFKILWRVIGIPIYRSFREYVGDADN